MKSAATLSQLGSALDMSAARVRHHLKILEGTGMVELVKTQQVRGFLEKYYRATDRAYFINVAVLPEPDHQGTIYLFGSHDPALELLADYMDKDASMPNLLTLPVGSLDGLMALRQGHCQVTSCHLFDPIVSEYNTPYIRHFFPGQEMHIITLAHRQQGLMVTKGNRLDIKGLEDLEREDVIFINRKRGSGTRLWLDQQLNNLGIDWQQIRGYEWEVDTHSQVAEAVFSGSADVGLAVLAAGQNYPIDFVPLFEERFDLVVSDIEYSNPKIAPLFESINYLKIRKEITSLLGYRSTDTGKEVLIGK
jgi:putative molybdopterin biosynthesis protein